MTTATVQEIETLSTNGEADAIRSFELALGDTKVHVCSVGASILKYLLHEHDEFQDIVLGYPHGEALHQTQNPYYFQAVVGRVANRIRHGRFSLNQKTYDLAINNPPNHLHGGLRGFSHRIWQVESIGVLEQHSWCGIPYVRFSLDSTDGDQGYPGHVHVSATYSLRPSISGAGSTVRLEVRAYLMEGSELCTPINLAQHSYFNLAPESASEDGILNHSIQLESDFYTPLDSDSIPTKEVHPVKGHPVMDLSSQPRQLRDILTAVGTTMMNLPATQVDADLRSRRPAAPYGVDHNFVVRKQSGVPLAKVATLACGSRRLHVHSSAPGVQVYTGNYLGGDDVVETAQKQAYRKWSGICLETQYFPDSINDDTSEDGDFAQGRCPILTPSNPDYEHVVEYTVEFDSDPTESIGSDTNNRKFSSIDAMWRAQNLNTWYQQSLDYYDDHCPSTVDGVLGGMGEVSHSDLEGSRRFLNDLGWSMAGTACECGAGIGRVTKGLLLDLFPRCDLVESCSRLLSAAPDYIGNESYRCRFFCTQLQNWQPQKRKYCKYYSSSERCHLDQACSTRTPFHSSDLDPVDRNLSDRCRSRHFLEALRRGIGSRRLDSAQRKHMLARNLCCGRGRCKFDPEHLVLAQFDIPGRSTYHSRALAGGLSTRYFSGAHVGVAADSMVMYDHCFQPSVSLTNHASVAFNPIFIIVHEPKVGAVIS
jgi:aldose 1-epimerase